MIVMALFGASDPEPFTDEAEDRAADDPAGSVVLAVLLLLAGPPTYR